MGGGGRRDDEVMPEALQEVQGIRRPNRCEAGAHMKTLVANANYTYIPKDGRGRLIRFVIDVDADAVQSYIYEAAERSEPWPTAVVLEIIDTIADFVRREGIAAIFAERHE